MHSVVPFQWENRYSRETPVFHCLSHFTSSKFEIKCRTFSQAKYRGLTPLIKLELLHFLYVVLKFLQIELIILCFLR